MEEPGFSREISVTKTGAGNILDDPETSCCITLESKDMFKKQKQSNEGMSKKHRNRLKEQAMYKVGKI